MSKDSADTVDLVCCHTDIQYGDDNNVQKFNNNVFPPLKNVLIGPVVDQLYLEAVATRQSSYRFLSACFWSLKGQS